MGYFYAVLSSIMFSLYAFPKKFAKLEPIYYVLFMGISSLFLSVMIYFLLEINEPFFYKSFFISLSGGVIWFLASFLFFYCIDKIGIAKSTQFKSLQGPLGSLMMFVFLKEYKSLNVILLIFAVVFILMSSFVLVDKGELKNKNNIAYIILAILSAFLYGLSGFIRKSLTIKGLVYSQQIYCALGIIVASFLFILLRDKKLVIKKENTKKYSLALLSGVFYYFASFTMLVSYKYIEGAIAFSLIQLNSMWSALIGILIFKEIKFKEKRYKIILSFVFALIGIVFLLLS